MILEILRFGHPALRAATRKVTKIDSRIRQLAADMVETLQANQLVGMAAPQIGSPLQIFVLNVFPNTQRPSTLCKGGKPVPFGALMPMIVINPEIELSGELESGEEGSPCTPEIRACIKRYTKVHLRARNLENEPMELRATGFLARVIQHEFDHLQGILMVDRLQKESEKSPSFFQEPVNPLPKLKGLDFLATGLKIK